MKDLNEMTPIELNILVNKINENHQMVRDEIYKSLDQVDDLKKTINSKLIIMKNLEDKYVEIMGVLMSKQE